MCFCKVLVPSYAFLAGCWSLATAPAVTEAMQGLVLGWEHQGLARGWRCQRGCAVWRCTALCPRTVSSRWISSQMKLLLWSPLYTSETFCFCRKEVAPLCSPSKAALLGSAAETKVWCGISLNSSYWAFRMYNRLGLKFAHLTLGICLAHSMAL